MGKRLSRQNSPAPDSSADQSAEATIAEPISSSEQDIIVKYTAKDYLYDDLIIDSIKYDWNDTIIEFIDEYESSDAFQLKEAERLMSINDMEPAKDLLQSIIPSINTLQNLKDILSLQMDSLAQDTTSQAYQQIVALANSCPYTNGKAVYYARALLISQWGNIEFDDQDLCSEEVYSSERRGNPSIVTSKIQIIPNPVASVFTVKNDSEKEIAQYEIRDMQGRLLLASSGNTIDLSKYSQGYYILHIRYADNSSSTQYFIKE